MGALTIPAPHLWKGVFSSVRPDRRANENKGGRRLMTLTLQEMSDRFEIQDLLVAYCYAVDNQDFDDMDHVFAPGAIIDYSEMVGVKGQIGRASCRERVCQ